MHDLAVTRHFVERGVSGSVPQAERPEGGALLRLMEPGDIVITPKLDRCFRSALDALDVLRTLKDRSVAVHMIDLRGDVSGSGISKPLFTILSAVAEVERDRIRERISDVKRDQRQRGRYLGGRVPFGYQATEDGDLVEVEEQQAAVRAMVDLKRQGTSLRAIAEWMKAQGFAMSHKAVR